MGSSRTSPARDSVGLSGIGIDFILEFVGMLALLQRLQGARTFKSARDQCHVGALTRKSKIVGKG
jgi:hypothetical protein